VWRATPPAPGGHVLSFVAGQVRIAVQVMTGVAPA
jgi:hypothetical protein